MENNSKSENKKNNFYKTKTTTLVSFRLLNSDVEKLNLITKETKIGKSKILRSLIEGNPIQVIEIYNNDLSLNIDKLIKIFSDYGNNINQIALNLNKGNDLDDSDRRNIINLSENLTKLIDLLNNKKTIKRKI